MIVLTTSIGGRERGGERGQGTECRRLRTNLLLSWRAVPEPERVITAAHKLLSVSCKLHDKVISTPCWKRGECERERERGRCGDWVRERKQKWQKKRMSKKRNANSAANKYFISATHTHICTWTQKPQHVCMHMCVCVCNNMTLTNVQRAATCCVLWHTHATTDRRQRHIDSTRTHTHLCIAYTHKYM